MGVGVERGAWGQVSREGVECSRYLGREALGTAVN